MRREYKYLIDERIVDRVRKRIEGICVPDEFAPTGRYLTDTLYIDTLRLDLYRATVENERVREKLRIRSYPNSKVVFLEVKRRVDDIIVKHRAALPKDSWADILETGAIERVPFAEQIGAERFFAKYHRRSFVPQLVVRYEREPYESTLDDYARVTFDRKISARAASRLAFDDDDAGFSPIDHPLAMKTGGQQSYVVLELKFSDNAPAWMRDLVRSIEMPRLAFSKYARGVETTLRAPADVFAT